MLDKKFFEAIEWIKDRIAPRDRGAFESIVLALVMATAASVLVGVVATALDLPQIVLWGLGVLIWAVALWAVILVLWRRRQRNRLAASTVTLTIVSPSQVDELGIRTARATFKHAWPRVEIDWRFADPLLDAMQTGLAQGALNSPGGAAFHNDVPAELGLLTARRDAVAAKTPGLVRRLAHLDDDAFCLAMRCFLLFANFRVHGFLAWYSSWQELAKLDVSLPAPWRPFQKSAQHQEEEVLPILFGAGPGDEPIRAANVYAIGDAWVRDAGFVIYAPKNILARRQPSVLDLCRWHIPQLEYQYKGKAPVTDYLGKEWDLQLTGTPEA